MSFQAMTWAGEQRAGGPSGKAVLWAIANFANQDGVAWPSQQLLAEQSEQSVDSVQKRLGDLAARRLLRRIPLRYAGRKAVDFIVLAASPFFVAPLEVIAPMIPRGFQIDPKAAADAAANCGSDENATAAPDGAETCGESRGAPSGDVAADCGSDENATLPQTLPQLAPPRYRTGAVTRTSKEPEEPERERRAREPEIAPQADHDFQALLAKVVALRGPQPVSRCFPAWQRLSLEERGKALAGWDSCVSGWRAGGGKFVYTLAAYLHDRMWQQAPPPDAETAPMTVVAARSAEWWFFLHRLAAAGETRRAKLMLGQAKSAGTGWAVRVAELPGPELLRGLVAIETGGAAFAAWRRHLERLGLRLGDDPTVCGKFVYMPAEWPDEGRQSGVGNRQSEGAEEEFSG